FPAGAQASRRAALQGPILRAFRQCWVGDPHAQRAAEIVPAQELYRQLLRDPQAALPALPDPPLLGPLRRPDRPGRLCRAGRGREGLPRRQVDPGAAEARRTMQQASDEMDFELAAVYRDRLRALTFIQGTQTIAAEGLG